MSAHGTTTHPLPPALADLIADRFRVLGEPMRIRLLDALRDAPASVQELQEATGASQQNVSKHLGVLPRSGRRAVDRSHDARDAMVGAVAHSGRVIFAAAAVMVAVFFTFALSGPLPPKEMGIILGVAVLLDAALVRLLLLPVLLRLIGARAWYLPAWARRILPDIRFGHS